MQSGSAMTWQAFAVTRKEPPSIDGASIAPLRGGPGWRIEIQGQGRRNWEQLAQELLRISPAADAYLLSSGDAEALPYRGLLIENGIMAGALFVGASPFVVPEEGRDWLDARLGTVLDAGERFRLLDGRPGGAMTPRGAIVCFCCHVGANAITEAIEAGCRDVVAVGAATRAGTNCGRCHSDIARLIASTTASV